MLLAQLHGFVEVARLGNMGRAADVLSISQPALSSRIKGLESELGVQLFRRTATGMSLTPAGRGLVPHAERALAAVRMGVGLAKDLDHNLDEDLTVGATRSVSTYVLPELLARFLAVRPGVRVTVRTADSESLVAMLRQGEIHVAVIREIPTHGLDARPIYVDDLAFVARPGAVSASSGAIGRDQLARVPVIVFDRHSNYYELTQGIFSAAGVVPSRPLEVDNLETAKRMAERGLGLSLLPATAVADAIARGTLTRIRVVGVDVEPRRIMAVQARDATSNRAVEELIELLRQTPDLIPGAGKVPDDYPSPATPLPPRSSSNSS